MNMPNNSRDEHEKRWEMLKKLFYNILSIGLSCFSGYKSYEYIRETKNIVATVR